MDYITAIMQKATELATLRDVKVSTEDIMFVVRKVSQCLDKWQPDQADWLATGRQQEGTSAVSMATTAMCFLSEGATRRLLAHPRTCHPCVLQDTKKFERARELLQKDKEIKAAKKVSTGHSSMLAHVVTGCSRSHCCNNFGHDPLRKPPENTARNIAYTAPLSAVSASLSIYSADPKGATVVSGLEHCFVHK